jgi:hypothetical protein
MLKTDRKEVRDLSQERLGVGKEGRKNLDGVLM